MWSEREYSRRQCFVTGKDGAIQNHLDFKIKICLISNVFVGLGGLNTY